MNVVRIKEYGKSRAVSLTGDQIRGLRQFDGKIKLEPSDEPGNYFIWANSWIGNFTTSGLVVEISPKIGPVNALKMQLLGDGEANPLLVESLNRAAKFDHFWDLIAELLINTVSSILKDGLRRSYIEVDENSEFFRGELLVPEDIVRNVPVRTGTFCRHTELTADIEVNRALLWGLETLGFLVSKELSGRIKFMTFKVEGVSHSNVAPNCDHKFESGFYRLALFLVNLIRSSLQTSSSTFGLSSFGLMMDMNKVFEGYVRNQLRIVFEGSGVDVPDKRTGSRPLCENVMLNPDFLIRQGPSILAICDCKYKVNWRFQNPDVYQMLAYLEGFKGVGKAVIFYPHSRSSDIVTDHIKLPRSGTLYSVGLPVERLLDVGLWDEVREQICKIGETNIRSVSHKFGYVENRVV